MLGLQARLWSLSSIHRNTGGQVSPRAGPGWVSEQTWHTNAFPGEENIARGDVQGEVDFF